MNYPENTKDWQVGDIVIHDFDAKKIGMLMVVVRIYKTTGLIGTRYIYPAWAGCQMPLDTPFKSISYVVRTHVGRIWKNERKYLHDPKLFDLPTNPDYEQYWAT